MIEVNKDELYPFITEEVRKLNEEVDTYRLSGYKVFSKYKNFIIVGVGRLLILKINYKYLTYIEEDELLKDYTNLCNIVKDSFSNYKGINDIFINGNLLITIDCKRPDSTVAYE